MEGTCEKRIQGDKGQTIEAAKAISGNIFLWKQRTQYPVTPSADTSDQKIHAMRVFFVYNEMFS